MLRTKNTSSDALTRRHFLRGAGVALALPTMSSLVPSAMANSAAQRATRLSVFYTPNGMRMPEFVPVDKGLNYTSSEVLQVLNEHKQKFSVVTGLAHYNANALGDGPGAHGRSCATYLTGAHPKRTEGADLYCGLSFDQFVANDIGPESPLASLELGIEPPSLLGSCDVGYSCAYTNTMSWRSPTSPLPVSVKPREVFERLFGNTVGLSAVERQKVLANKSSILDYVLEDAARMSGTLGERDRHKMNEYLDSIRAVERRVEKSAEQKYDIDPGSLTMPAGIPDDFEQHVQMMIDLQVLALQSNMTRVCTFMLGRELSNRAYPEIGVPDSHHSLSHHGGDPQKIKKLIKINQFHLKQYGYLLDRLATTYEGEHSLLDTTLVFGGASLGEPNDHDCMDLPALLAGGGIQGNRHISLAKDTPMCNLMLSLAHELGMDAESFGDSTGELNSLRVKA